MVAWGVSREIPGGLTAMRAVLRLAVHEFRARWLSWAVLVLLVGLAGGTVLTAAAGARRTDTAYPRFLRAYRASDMLVGPAGRGIQRLLR